MKALVFSPEKGLHLAERPLPPLPRGGLIIKVMAAAICGSDLRILRREKEASPGVILGHEVAGIVERVSDTLEGYHPGEAVVLFPSIFCGTCIYCQRGLANLCLNKRSIGYRLDGGFAQYMAVPPEMVREGAVVKLQGKAPWTTRALIEPLACVLHSVEIAGKGEEFFILGGGPMGLMHVLVLLARGAKRVFVAERDPHRAKLVREIGGERVEVLQKESWGRELGEERVDGVFFCARAGELIGEGLALMRKGGTLNLFAGYPPGREIHMDPNLLHYGERKLTGTHSTTLPTFRKAALMVEEGQIDLSPLVTHTFPLEEWDRAFHTYASGEGLKVVFTPHGNSC